MNPCPCPAGRRGFGRLFLIVILALLGFLSLPPCVAAAPRISSLAGTGKPGYQGDHGPARTAALANPYGLIRGPDQAIYICEVDNHVVRRIDPEGLITTLAGIGERGYSGDGGLAMNARLNEPYEVRFDSKGRLLIVEMKNHLVRLVDRGGRISTLAGTGLAGFGGDGGPATSARLNQPHSIQVDRDDNLFICDIGNHRIRRVDHQSGIITTFAGTGGQGPTPDGAPLEGTPLNGPRALDFDRAGNLWVALREGNAVYKADLKAHSWQRMAGTGAKGFTGNGGPARLATLSGPKGLSIGPDGDVYLTDTESHSIRKIDVKRGTLELVAGTGQPGDGPEGDPLGCRLTRPHGIFVDGAGRILVGDSEAHRVRLIQ